MRPLDDASLGRCVPWTMSPLDDASLRRYVPDHCVPVLDHSHAVDNHHSYSQKLGTRKAYVTRIDHCALKQICTYIKAMTENVYHPQDKMHP
jgi:hypothetical protein